MTDWVPAALERLQAGGPVALVTILAVEGSAPRDAGTKMLVWPEGQEGTIGGGNLEFQAAAQARAMLARGEAVRFAIQDYPLGPLLAQCCGGRLRLLFERISDQDTPWIVEAGRHEASNRRFQIHSRIEEGRLVKSVAPGDDERPDAGAVSVNRAAAGARAPKPGPGDEIVEHSAPSLTLLLFGAGHVGQAIARALAPLPFRVRWCDSRAAGAPPGVAVMDRHDLEGVAREGADFTLVLTHDQGLDYAIVAAALAGRGRGYLGLIGSRTKRARFLARLRRDGFADAALSRLTCPIGLPRLQGKAPAIIAASVAADLLMRVNAGALAADQESAVAWL